MFIIAMSTPITQSLPMHVMGILSPGVGLKPGSAHLTKLNSVFFSQNMHVKVLVYYLHVVSEQ